MKSGEATKAVLQIITDADVPADHAAHLASFFAEKGVLTEQTSVTPQTSAEAIDAYRNALRTDHPELPYFLYAEGHATYSVRAYLASRGDGLNGVILAGTGYVSPRAGALKVYGGKLRGLFGAGAHEEKDAAQALRKTMADVCTDAHAAKLPKNLAVFLASGAEDPAGDRGAGVRRVQEGMFTSGMTDISCKLYPDVAEDLFIKENADTFLADVSAFIETHLDQTNVSSYAFNRAYDEKKAAEEKDYEIDQILI